MIESASSWKTSDVDAEASVTVCGKDRETWQVNCSKVLEEGMVL